MIEDWKSALTIRTRELVWIVTSHETGDVLKARLPLPARHPRALLTMLEGLALWSGQASRVVISANTEWSNGCASSALGDELYPAESPLVRFTVEHRARRPVRLDGLGDFRALRHAAQGAR